MFLGVIFCLPDGKVFSVWWREQETGEGVDWEHLSEGFVLFQDTDVDFGWQTDVNDLLTENWSCWISAVFRSTKQHLNLQNLELMLPIVSLFVSTYQNMIMDRTRPGECDLLWAGQGCSVTPEVAFASPGSASCHCSPPSAVSPRLLLLF